MEDIVTKLYQWGLPYVVERVFSYLDYSDIKNAILVSSTWSNILNGEWTFWPYTFLAQPFWPNFNRAIREAFLAHIYVYRSGPSIFKL